MKYPLEMPDEKLIQFYLSNDPTAIIMLTDLYKDRIYNSIYVIVKTKDAAEEIFRNVFIRVINNLIAGKNAEDGNFLQWALQVANQLSLEYNYKAALSKKVNNVCTGFNYENELVESLTTRSYYEKHILLRQMINKLPEMQKEIIVLIHYTGLSFRELANKMKCSVTNALDIMKTALNNLQRLISEHELIVE